MILKSANWLNIFFYSGKIKQNPVSRQVFIFIVFLTPSASFTAGNHSNLLYTLSFERVTCAKENDRGDAGQKVKKKWWLWIKTYTVGNRTRCRRLVCAWYLNKPLVADTPRHEKNARRSVVPSSPCSCGEIFVLFFAPPQEIEVQPITWTAKRWRTFCPLCISAWCTC